MVAFQRLGYDLPEYAHVPAVAEPGSKNKLSKRKIAQYLKIPDFKKVYEHGQVIATAIGLKTSADTFNPVIVDFYREVGYLPDAIINYLMLLGWSLDDKTEFFSRQQMIDSFTLERVVKNPAGLDPDKLAAFQVHWMQQLTLDERIDGCAAFLAKAGIIAERAFVARVVETLGERLRLFADILDYDEFFAADDALAYDDKAFEKRIRNAEAAPLLERYAATLAAVEPFDAPALDAAMRAFCEREAITIGQIVHAVRVAATGKAVGPGLFESLALLGRDACVARIRRTLARLRQ